MRYMYPIMGIYTAYPKINIDNRCSKILYGQLHNENLHHILRVGRYRTTTCEMSGSDTVNCRGRVNIQDYMPSNFYLSFGFDCRWPRIYSLQGLRYNISFSNKSNKTSDCIDYSKIPLNGTCSKFYKETSLPNLLGDETMDHYENYFKQCTFSQAHVFVDGTCYKHIWEVVCHILLPKCGSVTKQVMRPCREMCQDILEGCWKKVKDLLARMGSEFREKHGSWCVDFIPSVDKLKLDDCDYLPSVHGSIPCFYKPVTCNSPPDVTNGTRILNTTQKDVYQLHDVVQYACVNDTFEMIRNSSSPVCTVDSGPNLHPNALIKEIISSYMIFILCFLFRSTTDSVTHHNYHIQSKF